MFADFCFPLVKLKNERRKKKKKKKAVCVSFGEGDCQASTTLADRNGLFKTETFGEDSGPICVLCSTPLSSCFQLCCYCGCYKSTSLILTPPQEQLKGRRSESTKKIIKRGKTFSNFRDRLLCACPRLDRNTTDTGHDGFHHAEAGVHASFLLPGRPDLDV